MDVLLAIVKFLVDEIFSKPFYLVGLMTAVGLIALRRPWSQVIGGTRKTTMGVLILLAGAVTPIKPPAPPGTVLLGATRAPGGVPTNEAILAPAQSRDGAPPAFVGV